MQVRPSYVDDDKLKVQGVRNFDSKETNTFKKSMTYGKLAEYTEVEEQDTGRDNVCDIKCCIDFNGLVGSYD